MTQKRLILEGLPDDLHQVRLRLDLYFKNKRRSGGEVLDILDYPGDKRKALLVYQDDGVMQKVLSKGKHQIDFKEPLGVIELHVKLEKDNQAEVKQVKPKTLPRPDISKLTMLGMSVPSTQNKVTTNTTKVEDTKTEAFSLLVRHTGEDAKEILEMYFEQFVPEYRLIRHGKKSWILKLSNRSDVEKILAKKEHSHGISVELHKERVEEGKLDPRRFILSGFDDNIKCKIISLYIGSCSQGAENVWETLDDGDRILVTFKEDIDGKSFLKKCNSKMVQGLEIAACGLEQTDSVLVQGDMSRLNEETISLYFSNKRSKGGEIASLIWVTRHKSIVITFKESHVASKVVEQKHILTGVVLTAQLFYSSLQKVLRGDPALQPDFPTKVAIPLCSAILGFISSDEGREKEMKAVLDKVHAGASINMAADPPQLELQMTMEKDSLGALRLGPAWEGNARREAQALLEKYKKAKLPSAMEVWERVESTCLGLNRPNARVSYSRGTSEIVVVGTHAVVGGVMEELEDIVKKAREDLETERDTRESKIVLGSKEEMDFIWDRISGKVADVELSKEDESICVKGLKDKVNTAERVVKEIQMNVQAKELDLSVPLVNFMMSLDLKKFERDHFRPMNISCVFLRADKSIKILGEQDEIQKAEDKLHKVIKEEVIKLTLEQNNVTNSEQWRQFQTDLTSDLKTSGNDKEVSISPSVTKIGICGVSSVVADMLSKITGYLENKKPTTEDVPLNSLEEVEYAESCMGLSDDPNLKALGVTILACKNAHSPCLKVTAASEKIKEAVQMVKLRVSAITAEKHVYTKAGESKALEKNEVALKAKAKELKCDLHLRLQVATVPQKHSYDIKGSITLTISQDNISQHASDALVCPLSGLALDNLIARQFLQSGGPKIKKVLDKFLKEKQSLLAGDVVESETGTLKAKLLLYAGIPVWGSSTQNITYLEAAVHDSLIKAENRMCTSVGMPALGCGPFGFPVKESGGAVIRGILQFITGFQASTQNLKNINIIETDAKLVADFQSAIEALGYHQTTVSNTATTSTTAQTTTVTQGSASQNSAPPLPAKPVSQVSVNIKMGDITKETVDVIVNSNNQNLNLNSGVSGAILKAAGQSVVDECKQLGPLNNGGVVLTGGGNLKCKHIAQMVGPGVPADITASMEKVFKLCDSKQAVSVSVPAIGTGGGGMDPKVSLIAILEALDNHTSQTAWSSIREVFIVSFEQKVYDPMNDILTKRNRRMHRPKKPKAAPAQSKIPSNQVMIHGIKIEVRKGDITRETVQGIVNTTNTDLNLTGGVSRAITKAAGSAMEQEYQMIRPLKGHVAGVTSGGDLQCDFILHMLGPHSVADATVRVTKVLERCEEKQITTVSFPAVGTGGGGLSGADSVGAILQGIDNHLTQLPTPSVVRFIYLLVDQDPILQAFQQGFSLWTSSHMDEDSSNEDDDSDAWTTDSESDDSSQKTNTVEAIIGPIKVKVLHGDITKEKTDVIVNSTNATLDLKTGVSGAILKAAGQAVVDECEALGKQPDDAVVLTKPGNLHSKHIMHMVGRTKQVDITSSMVTALKKCEDQKVQSVSFPALGTGAGNLGALQVGNAMMAAIADYLLMFRKPSVSTIHIVVFQAAMMKDFEEVMKQFKKVTPKPSATKITPKYAKTTSTFTLTKPAKTTSVQTLTKHPVCLEQATAAVPFPSMEVQVCGLTPASLAQVKAHLDSFLSEECVSQLVPSSHLGLLLEPEKEAIVALSRKNQVQFLVTASQDGVTVSGKKEDVLDSVLQIKDFLQKAKDRESRAEEESRLRKTVRWEVGEGEVWRELDSSLSYDLELAYHRKKGSFTYTHQGETYKVDLKLMQQKDSRGRSSSVKRTLRADGDIAVIQPPPSWTKMDSKDLSIVDLVSSSSEYQSVEKEFLQTSHNPKTQTQQKIQVVKIQRIQSKNQWQRYAVKKQGLDQKYPKTKNELNLYHGTTNEICKKITTNGFNRSFCGRNATMFGNGTYFAKETWYSCQDTYSNPDASGLKYMYRARVLVGKPCQGRSGIREPDPLNPSDPGSDLYDCAVDNLQNPFIYVVFCDSGAYPDYLISFKTV
ncbi:protein mono-ADP-ribosyltransferase PARP14 isoform X2 [Osmerus eperlanus]|uniref:protein mono-ADP-ribosyltransferase PARP14 isoform X2 n=1 Tax=Osmerus eperlanus TaxID=29151 RepID=UPI002E10F63D